MSRAINDMDNIASTLQQNLTQLITSIVTFVGVLWMMLTISWQLTLIALATVPLSLIVVMVRRLARKNILRLNKKLRIIE